ncbi:Mitochondrial presequence protease, partial [Cryomyces antarcticus]
MTRFLSGVDEDMAQTRREQLLDVTIADVRDAAEKFLVGGIEKENLAVLGERKEWVKEADGWQIRDLGMAEKAAGTGDDEGGVDS